MRTIDVCNCSTNQSLPCNIKKQACAAMLAGANHKYTACMHVSAAMPSCPLWVRMTSSYGLAIPSETTETEELHQGTCIWSKFSCGATIIISSLYPDTPRSSLVTLVITSCMSLISLSMSGHMLTRKKVFAGMRVKEASYRLWRPFPASYHFAETKTHAGYF